MRILDTLTYVSLSTLMLSVAACDVPEPDGAPAPERVTLGAVPQIANTRDDWHAAMRDLALPSKGCFTSDFPRVEWKQVACAKPPELPYPPKRGGLRPQTVGNGTDWSAQVSSGLISAAEGSFDAVAGVTTVDSTGTGGVSEFSLQLNTSFFVSPACAPSPNPGCRGWQQFIYSNTGFAFMQYWLIQYNTACPAGWNTFMFGPSTYCWRNSPGGVPVPAQLVSNLINMKLGGTAVAAGNDSVSIDTGGGPMSAVNADSLLTLSGAWTDAEFNLVGDCCGSDATFNAGSSVTVHTTVHNGTMNPAVCAFEGFTGETNSLTLVGTPALLGPLPAPGIVFDQRNVAPFTAASCSTAAATGDPHLHTFRDLLYDFQGIGDYLLAQRGPNFVVQTRQVSGAPSWPDAAVNKAVATRMGKTTVALCQGPPRLEIDGKAAFLEDGKQIDLPDASVSRNGNVYLITGHSGDSVRAELKTGGYINVKVGLGRWPDTVLGLLGNGRTASEIVARDGTVFTQPVSFQDLYFRFGDSWRVPASESLLCKDQQVELGNPRKPFCVSDLDPKTREHAMGVCLQFGVKQGPLLDACMLDVAMLGDGAAQDFVNAPPPVVVGNAGCR
jgi:hypothetical protein